MSSPVFWHSGDDPEMAKAMERARATFRYFWRELSWEKRRIVPGLDLAAIKAAFCDGEDPQAKDAIVEHMWLSEVEFDGVRLRATLLNEANELSSVSAGDKVELSLEELEDWMYAIDERVYGAHSINLMRARMSPSERRQHDGMWGLDFGDPSDVQLVPPPPDGRAFFTRVLGGGAPPRADLDADHPMSESVAPGLREQLAANPDWLTSANDDGLSMLHELALAGSAAGVAVLLEMGADRSAKTKRGLTAVDLARTLDWPRVVALLEG